MSVVVVSLTIGSAEALELNPLDFSSLGTLNTTADIVINSDTLQLSGGASFAGVLDQASHAAVFAFDNIQTENISIVGSSPLAILSKGNVNFNGPVNSSVSSELEIAAVGTVTVNNVVSSAGGSTLAIFANDIQINAPLSGTGRIEAGGNLTLATTQGLTPPVNNGPANAGSIIVSSSGGLFGSFSTFNIPPGEVQLFTGNSSLQGSTIVPLGLTIVSNFGVVIDGVAPVPLPAAAVLFGTGLIGLGSLVRRSACKSQT
jgi:hypothetical protein